MLSPFEKACLLWISHGKSVQDISLLSGRPTAEIELCLTRAGISLGAYSIEDAVETAKLSKGKALTGVKAPDPIDVQVGARIRSQRKLIGFSQGKLAGALGITFQQVQKYEKGTNRIGASRLQNIADVLCVPVTYLFDGGAGQSVALKPGLDPIEGHELMAFLESKEARDLNFAFAKILSPAVRKRVVILVKAIASSYPDAGSEAE